ncbi:MAG: DEAD/DEAH box helicase [Pseudomonadota bacterium]
MSFSDLGLSEAVLRAVGDVGYTDPTPIQAQAIPIVLQGRDVLGIAQTGTGKTASFTLPMIDILASGRAKARMPRSLILEPTRELAAQVAENFELYGKYQGLSYALLIGGERFDEQIRKLERGVDVLIATPGRMLDLFERGNVLLADVRVLVIDEADRMLDMGFIPDIERIVGLLPRIRQTLFFSATMPAEIKRLVDAFLINPKEISVAPPSTTADNVDMYAVKVPAAKKIDALRRLVDSEDVRNALIFCNRKRDVTSVFRALTAHGLNAGQLHGDMAQPARTETLEKFKNGEIKLLVCSDVAARGIDISDLSHVFNFDVPHNPEDYVHRIGRTGRAGRSGRAFTFATRMEAKSLAAIERLIKKSIADFDIEGLTGAQPEPEETPRPRRRGRKSSTADKAEPVELVQDNEPLLDDSASSNRPRRERPQSRRAGGSSRRRDHTPAIIEDDVPFGQGNDVPAFLLRPVPKQKQAPAA